MKLSKYEILSTSNIRDNIYNKPNWELQMQEPLTNKELQLILTWNSKKSTREHMKAKTIRPFYKLAPPRAEIATNSKESVRR